MTSAGEEHGRASRPLKTRDPVPNRALMRAAALGALGFAVAALLSGCGDDTGEAAAVEVPVAAAGEVYVPGQVAGTSITDVGRIQTGDPVYDRLHGTGPLVVSEVDGAVVGVISAATPVIEAAWGATPGTLDPDPRVPEVAGRPTVAGLGNLIGAPVPAETLGWRATDDTMVVVASRDLDLAGLMGVADRVQVAADGTLSVPGIEVGRINRPWDAPQPAIRVRYGPDEVVVHTATPATQAAYRALLHADPTATIDALADPSCCQPEILRPIQSLEIGDRSVVLGTLTPTTRALIIDGEPGAVLLAEVGLGVTGDDSLIALAESLTVVPESEVDARLAELGPSLANAPL